MSSHVFFCFQADCCNMTTELGSTCDACRQDWRRCPDCGDTGATVLGSNYCHECYSWRNHPCNKPPVTHCEDCGAWSQVFPDNCCHTCHMARVRRAPAEGWCPECDMYAVVLPNICADCQYKRDDVCTCDGGDETCDHCARYLADQAEYEIWCGVPEPQCTCDGSGRMCDHCAEEYAEPCRGCGVPSQLWTDNTYCRACFVARHGDEFPKTVRVSDELKAELLANLPTEGDKWSFTPAHPPLPPSPEPRHTSLESMRAEIAEIEARLKTNMTKGQKDDWIWLLQNRRADLAEAEKEMWEGYDSDDLRKLDRQLYHGGW
jgi:hypothetical protein